MTTPTEGAKMIATLYTTIGNENYVDKFDSTDIARQAFEATISAAADNPEIRGAILDLGGKDVEVWSADDGDETGAWSLRYAFRQGRERAEGESMKRVAFYKTDSGMILCDPCSVIVCRADHAIGMSRTYEAHSTASFPRLTCDMCGESHVVKQSEEAARPGKKLVRDMDVHDLRRRLTDIERLNPHTYQSLQSWKLTAARIRCLMDEEDARPATPKCPKCGMAAHGPDRFCSADPVKLKWQELNVGQTLERDS